MCLCSLKIRKNFFKAVIVIVVCVVYLKMISFGKISM